MSNEWQASGGIAPAERSTGFASWIFTAISPCHTKFADTTDWIRSLITCCLAAVYDISRLYGRIRAVWYAVSRVDKDTFFPWAERTRDSIHTKGTEVYSDRCVTLTWWTNYAKRWQSRYFWYCAALYWCSDYSSFGRGSYDLVYFEKPSKKVLVIHCSPSLSRVARR